jgi:hypothetical protein
MAAVLFPAAIGCSDAGNDGDASGGSSLYERVVLVIDDGRAAEEHGLYLIREDSGHRFGPARDYRHVAISPDGTRVAAVVQRDGERNDLLLFDLAAEQQIASIELESQSAVQWAFDGSAVAVAGADVVIVTRDGEELFRSVPDPARSRTEDGAFLGWSPDSTRYAFRDRDRLQIVNVNTRQVASADLDELLAAFGPPRPRLALFYWTDDTHLLFVELPEEGVRLDDQQILIVGASFDPDDVERVDDPANLPVPAFAPIKGSQQAIEATATALRSAISERVESAGLSADRRAQLFRTVTRRSELFVQEIATGEVVRYDTPEIDAVAGSEYISVYVAPP